MWPEGELQRKIKEPKIPEKSILKRETENNKKDKLNSDSGLHVSLQECTGERHSGKRLYITSLKTHIVLLPH